MDLKIIPVHLLSGKEYDDRQKRLNDIAHSCIGAKISNTKFLMKICNGHPHEITIINYNLVEVGFVPGYEGIITNYKVADIGFAPNELVMSPNRTIEMCVGISHNSTSLKVWFVSADHLPGITYWPELNSPETFAKAGFSRVMAK